MRTVTLQAVVNGVCARMGMDITQTVPAHTVAAYVEYINGRLRDAWESYAWPWSTRIEQREYRATYAADVAYAIGAEVFYSGAYYRATAAGTGNLPTDTSYWEIATDLVQVIDLDQAGETAIGEILGVYSADPRITPGAREYSFSLVEDGLLVPTGPAQPWIRFSLRPPVYTAADLALSTFPYVLADIVKAAAAADAQREDGQFDKASALESVAAANLDRELDKLELKQGQQQRWGV